MYAVAMGTSEWEAFVPRSHMPHLLTLGRRVFFAFIDTASPLLLYPRRSSLLIAPPFYTIGGAISFSLLIITLCLSLLALSRVRRWTRLLLRDACLLPVLMSYDFLGVSYE